MREGRGQVSSVLIRCPHLVAIQNTFWLSFWIHTRLNQRLSACAATETSGQTFGLVWIHKHLLALVALCALLAGNAVLAFGAYTANAAWLTCIGTDIGSTSVVARVAQ